MKILQSARKLHFSFNGKLRIWSHISWYDARIKKKKKIISLAIIVGMIYYNL